ncbi:MAG: hypothetical protein DRG31_02525 [Deltaproteobacteria bacterium]|nr:MAG: hypothetical protein DRG31_02525 [Deltaproteobacteria bacterium]
MTFEFDRRVTLKDLLRDLNNPKFSLPAFSDLDVQLKDGDRVYVEIYNGAPRWGLILPLLFF